ncbi:MAG: leucine-rich repeat protein [Clostridia bacterium]|nr:leucine-rich repeat protein [Clostridia bacterium]
MKRFLLTVLMMIAMMSLLFVAEAAEKKSGLFTYELKGNGTVVITKYDWNANKNEDVYIPRMIDGYIVTEIGENAFSDKSASLENKVGNKVVIIIPDTVKIIGAKAFFCSNITSADIPVSVELIGEGAFAGCRYLTQFYVNEGNPTYTTIDGVLFNKKEKMLVAYPYWRGLHYIVPRGILSIGGYAFYGCGYGNKSIGGLGFGSTTTNIGDFAFAYAKLIDHYDFPSELREIGDYAFYQARGLEYLEFNNKLQYIGKYAFSEAELEDIELSFPGSVIEIGEGAFSGLDTNYRRLKVDLSNTKITKLPSYVFFKNVFNYVKLPNTLEIIERSAMEQMEGSVVVPASVKHIEDKAFFYGSGELTFAKNSCLISIGNKAFAGYDFFYHKELVLPTKLVEIGNEAFLSAEDLEVLCIPNSVSKIGDAFCDRAKITLQVEAGSYASIYASENGYKTKKAGSDDTSWLNS